MPINFTVEADMEALERFRETITLLSDALRHIGIDRAEGESTTAITVEDVRSGRYELEPINLETFKKLQEWSRPNVMPLLAPETPYPDWGGAIILPRLRMGQPQAAILKGDTVKRLRSPQNQSTFKVGDRMTLILLPPLAEALSQEAERRGVSRTYLLNRWIAEKTGQVDYFESTQNDEY